MTLIGKTKQKVAKFKEDWQAAGRRIDEDNAQRPAPSKPSPPSAAEQQRIQHEGQWVVINNQQQGLTDPTSDA